MPKTIEERFWAKVEKTETCWLWTAATVRGYGVINIRPILHYAHRLAYEMLVGEIPAGHQIDHLCRNPLCVNPAHLEAVTQTVNLLRGVSGPALNARKTHCKRGHPLTSDNLTTSGLKLGWRWCRTCAQERERQRTKRRLLERHAARQSV